MPQRLSSATTFVWTLVFPVLWIGGFGTATLSLWLGVLHGRGGEPAPEWLRWFFLGAWLLASTLVLLFPVRLCRVILHGESWLEVFRWGRVECVPLSAVVRVTQSYLGNPPTVTLHLDAPSKLGRCVRFLPRGRPRHVSEYPIVGELQAMAALARARHSAVPDAGAAART